MKASEVKKKYIKKVYRDQAMVVTLSENNSCEFIDWPDDKEIDHPDSFLFVELPNVHNREE